MPKCDFNKVAPFPKNTSGGLLLNMYYLVYHYQNLPFAVMFYKPYIAIKITS